MAFGRVKGGHLISRAYKMREGEVNGGGNRSHLIRSIVDSRVEGGTGPGMLDLIGKGAKLGGARFMRLKRKAKGLKRYVNKAERLIRAWPGGPTEETGFFETNSPVKKSVERKRGGKGGKLRTVKRRKKKDSGPSRAAGKEKRQGP